MQKISISYRNFLSARPSKWPQILHSDIDLHYNSTKMVISKHFMNSRFAILIYERMMSESILLE